MESCPFCNSENIYYSRKRRIFVCEDCDETFSDQQLREADGSPSSGNGLELFFSYGHDKNRLLVERIKRDLEKRGHKVWIDTSEIKAGDHWRDDVLNGVLNASTVVAFLSEHSTRQPGVCLDELKIAVCVKGSNIKTVLLEPENRIRPPATISDIQWLDMSSWSDRKRASDSEFEEWYTKKFAELCRLIESQDSIELYGEISLLKERLTPYLNSEKEYNLLSKKFYGRRWLEEYIEEWQDNRSSKALMIYGRPGSGKSAFCVNYAHYNSDVLGCFLCEWNREHTTNPKRLLKTMAFRLASKLPDYRSLLLHQLEDGAVLDELSADALFDLLLAYPLSHLVDGGRETGIIIVDGLDEAESEGDNPVAEVFAKCVDRLPRWIRFVFTSRPETNVSKHFGACESIDIVEDIPLGYNDIMAYLVKSLSSELQTIPNRLETLNRVCELSDGIFLYAELLVNDIKDGVVRLSDVESFPRGLNSFYRLSMKRKFPTEEAFTPIRGMLEMLAISDAIPERLLCIACGFTQYEYLTLLDSLGSWVNRFREDGQYLLRFSHKSMGDWFVSRRQSSEYYVDYRLGALNLARCCKEIVDVGDRNIDSCLESFAQGHVGDYYAKSERFDELEQFLLSHHEELGPFWIVWSKFPTDWDNTCLLDGLWTSPARNSFLKGLQREGDVNYLYWLFGVIETRYEVNQFDREMLSIYMDIVHMSGGYEKAVGIADEYLAGHIADIAGDEFLAMLSVRRLHHSMFFRPTGKLLDEAKGLYAQIGDEYPLVTNELLFLIGGNLGVLYGDWDFCRAWLDKSIAFASTHALVDFQKRNARKDADYYCHMGAYDRAEEILKSAMTTDGSIEGRYEAYLVGALANLYTCIGADDEAMECYERLLRYTSSKGIIGWTAHANLGFANVNYKLGNTREAVDFAVRAREIYREIKQEWGLIMCEALLGACESVAGIAPIDVMCQKAIDRANRMQYGSSRESIERLVDGSTRFLELYFL